MEFNDKYDFFFENKGFCPECGKYLIVHIGCLTPYCKIGARHKKETEYNIIRGITRLLPKSKNARKNTNLDIREKKSYSKLDD